ncbi:MAG: DUF481 domain-containing protein [Burkholderiaceae bacterium]
MNSKKNVIQISVLAAGILAATQVQAQQTTVSVTDYREATSAYDELYLRGSLNAGESRTDDQTAYDLNLGINYDQVFASPDRDFRLRADGDTSVSRGGTAGDERDSRYDYSASATVDNYFNRGSSNAFWYGSLGIQGTDAFDSRQISGILGLGYGRVVNVTPMAKAIRVVEELRMRGQLTSEPSLDVYQRVANIIDRESEYRSRHGAADYQEIWISDIAKELQTAGGAAQTLDAAEIIRIDDILTRERISTRRVGWKVRAGLGYVFRSFSGDSNSDPALELGAEYHYPLSNRTQFSDEAVLTTIVNDNDDSYTLRNVMSLTHEIADRVDWENAWTLTYDKNGPTGTATTVNTVSTALFYELRNQLDLTTTLALSNYSGDETVASPNGTDTSLFVGLRYRLK